MRLLFDQNISFRLVKGIRDIFPSARQVRELKLENATDREIWEYAKKEGYSIVTFDSDFYDLTLLLGIPPKVIWLRLGNTSTDTLIDFIRKHSQLIIEFIEDKANERLGCLELHQNTD